MGDDAGGRSTEIALENPNRYEEVDRESLREWLREVVGELAPGADSLAVRFVGERAMRRLNASYRSIDRSTDVLSFPGEETPG